MDGRRRSEPGWASASPWRLASGVFGSAMRTRRQAVNATRARNRVSGLGSLCHVTEIKGLRVRLKPRESVGKARGPVAEVLAVALGMS